MATVATATGAAEALAVGWGRGGQAVVAIGPIVGEPGDGFPIGYRVGGIYNWGVDTTWRSPDRA